MKIGIVGCGAIGTEVARVLVSDGGMQALQVVGINDVNTERAQALAVELNQTSEKVRGKKSFVEALPLDEMLTKIDLLVQASSVSTMPDIVRKALNASCDVLVLSVGGFAKALDLPDLAAGLGRRLYVPSGAIAGIDAVLAAREAGLHSASLATTKHPKSLLGAPYLEAKGIDLMALEEATCIFEGSAREAIEGFPANSNVAITLSFAGVGMEATRVRIIADPAATLTRHEVRASGEAGTVTAITECTVSPVNPKTSHLAIVSALALLRGLCSPLYVGT